METEVDKTFGFRAAISAARYNDESLTVLPSAIGYGFNKMFKYKGIPYL